MEADRFYDSLFLKISYRLRRRRGIAENMSNFQTVGLLTVSFETRERGKGQMCAASSVVGWKVSVRARLRSWKFGKIEI